MSIREAKESPIEIGTSERRAISFDFAAWGLGTISAPAVVVYLIANNARTDVTSTVMPSGSASVNGSVVTSPLFRGDLATVNNRYRVECAVSHGSGEISEMYIDVTVKY